MKKPTLEAVCNRAMTGGEEMLQTLRRAEAGLQTATDGDRRWTL